MLEALLEKITADVTPAPCGKDPVNHPLYEAISDQRNRGGPFSGSADWKKTEELCIQFLSEVSKELGVINTLVVALTHNHGMVGLNTGLALQTEFCKKYWKDMFPVVKDKKRRIKAMRWLNERIKDLVKGDQLKVDNRETVEKAEGLIKDLHESLLELEAGKAIPSFADLKEWVQTKLIKMPKAAPKPEPAPAPAAAPAAPAAPTVAAPQPAPVAAAPAAQPMAVTGAPADDASVDEQLAVLGKIAINIHAQAPHMALAYRLLRMAKWQNAKVPSHESNGETRIPAPNEQIISSLKTMAQRQAWVDLLNRCEDLTMRIPLWLELQYYAAMAAGSLGDAYEEILDIIESETAGLFKRFPKLASLKFNNGTPLATSAAVAWLEGLGQDDGGGGGGVDESAALRSSLLKLGEAKFDEALKLAQESIDKASSPLLALKLKLEAASFALNASQGSMALAMLRGLASEIRTSQLQRLEPKWCARVWSETVKACRNVGDKANVDLENEAMMALSGLDLSLFAQLKVEEPKS